MEHLRILVPLDFSEMGSKALSSAERMARLFNGTITPFHTYLPLNEVDGGPYMYGMNPSVVENYDEIEEALHKRLKEVAEQEVDPSLLQSPLVAVGNPAQAIVEEAQNFDMIVLTTHGRTGFSRFFLGSVSEKVLRSTHVPVLITNEKRELKELNRILLTTDFSDHSKEAFPEARAIALKSGAEIELVNVLTYDAQHVNEPDDSKVELRKQRLEVLAKEELHEISDQVTTHLITSTKTPHEAIIDYNEEHPHDLIVMSTVGRTGITYLMMGSTTGNVVRHSKSPVLSVNPKAKNNS